MSLVEERTGWGTRLEDRCSRGGSFQTCIFATARLQNTGPSVQMWMQRFRLWCLLHVSVWDTMSHKLSEALTGYVTAFHPQQAFWNFCMGSWAKNLLELVHNLQETSGNCSCYSYFPFSPPPTLHYTLIQELLGCLIQRREALCGTPRKAQCGQAVLLSSLSLLLCQTPRLWQPGVLSFAFLYPLGLFPPFPPSDLCCGGCQLWPVLSLRVCTSIRDLRCH